jgi:hypothetical protein
MSQVNFNNLLNETKVGSMAMKSTGRGTSFNFAKPRHMGETSRNLMSTHRSSINMEGDVSKAGLPPFDVISQAGPVRLDNKCLSCAGVPSHTMELFKTACIQYQPS